MQKIQNPINPKIITKIYITDSTSLSIFFDFNPNEQMDPRNQINKKK